MFLKRTLPGLPHAARCAGPVLVFPPKSPERAYKTFSLLGYTLAPARLENRRKGPFRPSLPHSLLASLPAKAPVDKFPVRPEGKPPYFVGSPAVPYRARPLVCAGTRAGTRAPTGVRAR